MIYDVPVNQIVIVSQAEPEDAERALEVLTRQNGYLPYPVINKSVTDDSKGITINVPLCWFNTGTDDARTFMHRLLNETNPSIPFYERGYVVQ